MASRVWDVTLMDEFAIMLQSKANHSGRTSRRESSEDRLGRSHETTSPRMSSRKMPAITADEKKAVLRLYLVHHVTRHPASSLTPSVARGASYEDGWTVQRSSDLSDNLAVVCESQLFA